MKYVSHVLRHDALCVLIGFTACLLLCACPSAPKDPAPPHPLQSQCLSRCSNDQILEHAQEWEADSNYLRAKHACHASGRYRSCTAQMTHFSLLLTTHDSMLDCDLGLMPDNFVGDTERFEALLTDLHDIPPDLRRAFVSVLLEACQGAHAGTCMMGDGHGDPGWLARYRQVIEDVDPTDVFPLLSADVRDYVDLLAEQDPQRRVPLIEMMSKLHLNEADVAQLWELSTEDLESTLALANKVNDQTGSRERSSLVVARRIGAAEQQQVVANYLEGHRCYFLDEFADRAVEVMNFDWALFSRLCGGLTTEQKRILAMLQAEPPVEACVVYASLRAAGALGTRFTIDQYMGLIADLPSIEAEGMRAALAALSLKLSDNAEPVYQALRNAPAQRRTVLARGIGNGLRPSRYGAGVVARLIDSLRDLDPSMAGPIIHSLSEMRLLEAAPAGVIAVLRDMSIVEREAFVRQAHVLSERFLLSSEERATAVELLASVQVRDREEFLRYAQEQRRTMAGLLNAFARVDDVGHFTRPLPTRAPIPQPAPQPIIPQPVIPQPIPRFFPQPYIPQPIPQNDALAAAISFWQGLAEPGHEQALADMPEAAAVRVHTNAQQETRLIAHSDRLKFSRDFSLGGAPRRSLARRFVRMLRDITASETVAAFYHTALEGPVTCSDQAALLMNQMELHMQVRDAERARDPHRALYELAQGLVRLEEIRRHADEKIARLRGSYFLDEVEVYLAYETVLGRRLALPVSTEGMLYRGCSDVSDAEIELAYLDARRAGEDSVRIQAYLESWEPWQKHLRKRFAEATTWDALPAAPPEALQSLAGDEICVYTQELITDLLVQGAELVIVRLPIAAGGQHWRAFDYEMFMHEWPEKGIDPSSRQPVSEASIYRLVR